MSDEDPPVLCYASKPGTTRYEHPTIAADAGAYFIFRYVRLRISSYA
jgi:hypothetical protein